MGKLKEYFLALIEKANKMLAVTEVYCFFCGVPNVISFDLKPHLKNLITQCCSCDKDFSFDVEVKFISESFDPTKLRAL